MNPTLNRFRMVSVQFARLYRLLHVIIIIIIIIIKDLLRIRPVLGTCNSKAVINRICQHTHSDSRLRRSKPMVDK